MKREELSRAQALAIMGGAALLLSLAMGMRQAWGLFQPYMIRDIGITAAEFSLAIAIQNIVWGITQPFVGALADRHGVRRVALAGVMIYGSGLLFSALAQSALMFMLGAGVLVGVALSCTASNIAMNVTARTASPATRSLAMGAVSALGSLGIAITSPLAQSLLGSGGWLLAVAGFGCLVAVMLPCALLAGGVDRIDTAAGSGPAQSAAEAVREALRHPGYVVMAIAYFVCGLQLVFITTHLPAYLEICGIDPNVGARALGLIGVFNVFGSLLFGWLGGRYSRRMLLGGIYVLRSIFIAAYFVLPPTPATTLVFAAAMGALWLGVLPLVTGLVVHLFGLRYMATLAGVAFFSHQVGSFFGAWGGGLIYSALGAYDRAWQAAVVIGLVAGLFQMSMNVRPSPRILAHGQAA